MRKRLTSILLTLAMLVGLLPALSPQAEASTGVAIVDVYSLADIKSAANQDQVRIIRLMKDIDASKENVTYDGDGFNTNSAIGRLASGCVLNGNGHTIYNLRGPLFANNMGNIHDLNVTLVHSDENSDIFAPGGYPLLSGIASWNDYRGVGGVIENCTVTMNVKRDFGNVGGDWLSIDGISQGGTIRNCIAKLNIDLKLDSNAYGGISVRGIGFSYNNSLTDHCLVLGSVKITSPQSSNADVYFTGISDGTTQDSACALDTLAITAKSARNDPYEHFTLGSGSEGTGTRNRVASDMNVNYTFNSQTLLSGSPTTASGNYTLDTRPNILKDWDLSVLPDEDTPNPTPTPTVPADGVDPFPDGMADFYYSATDGTTKKHSFYYNNLMFYSFDERYRYQSTLAKASLCLAMSAFTNCDNEVWDINLVTQDHRRAYNVQRLYQTLGFTNDQYYNYDKALTDTSDKVAFSIAMKYIDDGEANTDTLIAIPLRGGGYGGEWGSNFNITYQNYNQNHVGFQRAANGVRSELAAYLGQLQQSGKIKGSVKLWITGYSRSAATANILAHDVSVLTSLGGVSLSRKNIYAYTFATPAGAKDVLSNWDSNIFNIVSPVDIVPKVAPSQWNYSRYGTTLLLPMENSADLINTYKELSGEEGSYAELAILGEVQQLLLDVSTDRLFSYIPDSDAYYDRGLNETLSTGLGKLLGRKPSDKDPTGLITLLNGISDVCSFFDDPIKKAVLNQLTAEGANIGRAHHPELYLARLETGKLNTEADFTRNFNGKEIVVPLDKTLPGVTGGGANGKLDITIYDSNHQVVGSYQNGVCKSGSAAVNKTCMGVVFSLPDSSGDYTLSVRSGAESAFSFSVYTYDRAHTDGPARIVDFSDYPMSAGDGYTYTIPGGTTGKYLGRSTDGLEECNPDYDSQSDGNERSLDDHIPLNFTDVPANAYFHDAVEWAVEEGITSGTSATTFSPYNACTRAQVVTFLWRAAGCPEPESSYNPFSDVPTNAYYHDAVLWAAEEGITTGTSRTRFEPNATVTRAQTVTFLWRWAGSPEPGSVGSFRDVPYRTYYADAVAWAVEYGITNGTAPGLFSPAQTCTRAQIVTFLYRDLAAEWEDYET